MPVMASPEVKQQTVSRRAVIQERRVEVRKEAERRDAGVVARLMLWVVATLEAIKLDIQNRDLKRDTGANIALLGSLGLAITLVGAVVALLIVAKLSPQVIGAGAEVVNATATTDLGDDTANDLRPVFAMLIALGILFAIVGLVFGVIAFKASN